MPFQLTLLPLVLVAAILEQTYLEEIFNYRIEINHGEATMPALIGSDNILGNCGSEGHNTRLVGQVDNASHPLPIIIFDQEVYY